MKNESVKVLVYAQQKIHASTLRRHYLMWRKSQGIPLRCDVETCFFFSGKLEWNGIPLKLILDHINGVNSDNRPKNLRLVCPNCNTSLPTHGGRNKGKVEKSTGGFAIVKKNGGKNYYLPVEPASYTLKAGDVQLNITRLKTNDTGKDR